MAAYGCAVGGSVRVPELAPAAGRPIRNAPCGGLAIHLPDLGGGTRVPPARTSPAIQARFPGPKTFPIITRRGKELSAVSPASCPHPRHWLTERRPTRLRKSSGMCHWRPAADASMPGWLQTRIPSSSSKNRHLQLSQIGKYY